MMQKRWHHYLWQPLMAVFVMTVMLYFFNSAVASNILWAVGVGSLASSCCIVFAMPNSVAAKPFSIVGGYLVGIFSGEIIRYILIFFSGDHTNYLGATDFHVRAVVAAFSVAISILLMAVFKLEHPPAAGMALVLVLDLRDYHTLGVVLVGAILLALIREVLREHLVELV